MDIGTVSATLSMKDQFTAVLKNAQSQLQQFQGQLNTSSRHFKQHEEHGNYNIKMLERMALRVTALAVAYKTLSTVQESIKEAVDLTRQLTLIENVTNAGAEGVDELRQAFDRLTSQSGKGPAELAKGYYLVASASNDASTNMRVLDQAANLSAVGLGDTNVIAKTLIATLNAYGESNISASRAAAVLFETVKQGGAEADAIAGSIGRVVGTAAELGVSFDQLGTFIATFTAQGVSAAEAVTAVRQIMQSMLTPTRNQEEALAQLGMSMASLRREVEEDGLTEALIHLTHAAKGNEDAIGAVFPNIRALVGALGTAATQADKMRIISAAMSGSQESLARALENTRNSGAFAADVLVAKWELFKSELGNTVLPTVIEVGQQLIKSFDGSFARDFGAAVSDIVQVASVLAQILVTVADHVEILEAAFAFFLTGKLLLGIDSAVTALGRLAGASAAAATSTASASSASAGLLATLNPLGIAIAALVAAYVGLSALTRSSIAESRASIEADLAAMRAAGQEFARVRAAAAGGAVSGATTDSARTKLAELNIQAEQLRKTIKESSLTLDTFSTVAEMGKLRSEMEAYGEARGRTFKNEQEYIDALKVELRQTEALAAGQRSVVAAGEKQAATLKEIGDAVSKNKALTADQISLLAKYGIEVDKTGKLTEEQKFQLSALGVHFQRAYDKPTVDAFGQRVGEVTRGLEDQIKVAKAALAQQQALHAEAIRAARAQGAIKIAAAGGAGPTALYNMREAERAILLAKIRNDEELKLRREEETRLEINKKLNIETAKNKLSPEQVEQIEAQVREEQRLKNEKEDQERINGILLDQEEDLTDLTAQRTAFEKQMRDLRANNLREEGFAADIYKLKAEYSQSILATQQGFFEQEEDYRERVEAVNVEFEKRRALLESHKELMDKIAAIRQNSNLDEAQKEVEIAEVTRHAQALDQSTLALIDLSYATDKATRSQQQQAQRMKEIVYGLWAQLDSWINSNPEGSGRKEQGRSNFMQGVAGIAQNPYNVQAWYQALEGLATWMTSKSHEFATASDSMHVQFGELNYDLSTFSGKFAEFNKALYGTLEQVFDSLGGFITKFAQMWVEWDDDAQKWRVNVAGVQKMFKDQAQAVQFAVLEMVKASVIDNLSPEMAAVVDGVKRGIITSMEQLNKALELAKKIEGLKFGETAASIFEIVRAYDEQIKLALKLKLSITELTDALARDLQSLRNELLGIDDGALHYLQQLASFNAGLDQVAADLAKKIADAQAQLAAALAAQAAAHGGTPGGVTSGSGVGAGQGLGGEGGIFEGGGYEGDPYGAISGMLDQATAELIAQIPELEAALEKWLAELGALPQKLTDEEINMGIFDALYKYLEGNKKYSAQALEYARLKVRLEFEAIRAQLVALGKWEEFAAMFNDAYAAALAAAGKPGKGGGGKGGGKKDDAKTLQDMFADVALQGMSPFARQLEEINKKWKDAIPLAHGNKELLAKINQARADEIALLRAQAEQQYAKYLEDYGKSDFAANIDKFLRDLDAIPREVMPNWKKAIIEQRFLAEQLLALTQQLSSFTGDPLAAIAAIDAQAQALRDNFQKMFEEGAISAEQLREYFAQIDAGVDYQRQNILTGIFDKLFGIMRQSKEMTAKWGSKELEFAKKKVDLEFLVIEAQLKALGVWKDWVPEFVNDMHQVALDIAEAGDEFAGTVTSVFPYYQGGDQPEDPWAALREYFESMLYSNTSPLTVAQQFAAAQADYQAALAQATAFGGMNQEANDALAEAARQYQELAAAMYGTSTQDYADIFWAIRNQIGTILGLPAGGNVIGGPEWFISGNNALVGATSDVESATRDVADAVTSSSQAQTGVLLSIVDRLEQVRDRLDALEDAIPGAVVGLD